jgi:hypothetical protein
MHSGGDPFPRAESGVAAARMDGPAGIAREPRGYELSPSTVSPNVVAGPHHEARLRVIGALPARGMSRCADEPRGQDPYSSCSGG